MSKIYENILELIGETPMLHLAAFEKAHCPGARLLAKLEKTNPTCSAKDRIAMTIIRSAEGSGQLKPGGTIIEATSGNTGIGLAALGAALGYKVIIVMPDSMSVERRKLVAAYGAQVVLTEGALGMQGAVEKAKQLQEQTPGSVIADQFNNLANVRAHYLSTGPEIWRDTGGQIDAFVATVGSGGTITGAAEYLLEKNQDIRVFAVEPEASPLLSGGKAGPHKIQGIGANFIPSIIQRVFDEVVTVTDEEALSAMKELATSQGLLCGISSGAALAAAAKVASRPEYKGKTVVTLLPDTGERYLSIL